MASKRGFASMDPSKQREIASKGGRAAHAKGTAHEFTPDEARVAGRKGGEAVSRDRAHMSAIGREGGHSRGARARAAATSAQGQQSQQSDQGSRSDRSFNTNQSQSSERASFHAESRDRDRDRSEQQRGDMPSGNNSFSDRDNR